MNQILALITQLACDSYQCRRMLPVRLQCIKAAIMKPVGNGIDCLHGPLSIEVMDLILMENKQVTGTRGLSPRQKFCSIVVKRSREVNREKQALLAMGKGQAIGQLRLDPAPGLRTQLPIGLFENGFEPQAANA